MKKRGIILALSFLFVGTTLAGAEITYQRIPELRGFLNTHAISGNGTKIVFVSPSNPTGGNPDGNLEVFIYDLSAAAVFQITHTASQPNFLDHGMVRINHDGTRIAFQSRFALHSGGAQLPDKDVFIADVNYATNPPTVTFRRVTTTGERGKMALSGDGSTIVLVSNHNLAGRNSEGVVELFRVNLVPSINVTQLTDIPNGVADHVFDVDVDTSYDNDIVVFTSDRDLDSSPGNPELNQEIFAMRNIYVSEQITQTPAGVINRLPQVAAQAQYVAFVSNGNLTGGNPDGNFEVFLARSGTIAQITNTVEGDDTFGGANDEVDISGDGTRIVFRSNRDHAPAGSSSPGNADHNREVFMALIDPTNITGLASFTQITNTSNPHPGTKSENRFPRIDSLGLTIAFNSDLDLGVAGTSNLYAGVVEGVLAGMPPTISSFTPSGGGPGVPVIISGTRLAGATSVSFGSLNAISFDVVSASRIVATVPAGIVPGPITVVTPAGSVTSSSSFQVASFREFGNEFNQGFANYPPVAGKDTLVRVFSGVESSAGTAAIKITDAKLTVTDPAGVPFEILPEMYSSILRNNTQAFSENSNVNFYIPGSLLAQLGNYSFHMTLSTVGQQVYNQTFSRALQATKDVVLFFRSVLRHPDEDEFKAILRGFDTFSRVYPLRTGVGDLSGAIGASDFNTGLRVAYLAAPIWEDEPRLVVNGSAMLSSHCYWEINDALNDNLAAINSGGFEATEFGVAFIPTDKIPGPQGPVGCPIIDCATQRDIGNLVDDSGNVHHALGLASVEEGTAWVLLCGFPWGVFCHETGHLLGIDHPSLEHVTIAGPAFNVPFRKHISSPLNVMTFNDPAEQVFAHNGSEGGPDDYQGIFTRRSIGLSSLLDQPSGFRIAGPVGRLIGRFQHDNADSFTSIASAATSTPAAARTGSLDSPARLAAAPHEGQRFVLMAGWDEKAGVQIRHAFVTDRPGPVSSILERGPFTLVFLGQSARILHKEPLRFIPRRKPRQSDDVGVEDLSGGSLTVIRPLPVGTQAVRILRDDRVVATLSPGTQAPRLSVPRVERMKKDKQELLLVTWKAGDPDGDVISYHVEFSWDGGKTFVPLVPVTKRTEARFALGGLPGGRNLRVRVTASDGLHGFSSTTPAFSLPEHAPTAVITFPTKGRRYNEHETIEFRGLAYDLEDGIIGDRKLDQRVFRWFLDDEVRLGEGVQLTLSRTLRPGKHRITLKVADSTGKEARDSIVILVDADSDRDGRSDSYEAATPGFDPHNPYDDSPSRMILGGRYFLMGSVILTILLVSAAYLVWRWNCRRAS